RHSRFRRRRNAFASPCLDEHGADSSIVTALSCLPLRIRENFSDCWIGIFPKRGFRVHPSGGNPCGRGRRLGSDRRLLEVRERAMTATGAARAAARNSELMQQWAWPMLVILQAYSVIFVLERREAKGI